MVDTVLHTKTVIAEILTEAAIGGGDAGAAYAQAALTEANCVPMQSPPEGSGLTMPFQEVDRLFIPEIGSDVGSVKVFDQGILVEEQTFVQLIQDDRWIDAIVTSIAAGGGVLPTPTFGIHWEVGSQKEDVFGVYPIKWQLDLVPNTLPTQSTTVRFVSSKLGTEAAFTSDPVFSDAPPITNKNMGVAISAIGALKWKKATVMLGITTVEDPEVTEDEHRYPYIENIEVEIQLTFVEYTAQMLEVRGALASMTDIEAIITFGTGIITKDTLTISNLFIKPGSVNLNEFPDKGLFEFKMTLIPGDKFVKANVALA